MNKIKKYVGIAILTMVACLCFAVNAFASERGNYSYNLSKGGERTFVNETAGAKGDMRANSNTPQGARWGNASVTIYIEETSKDDRRRAAGSYNQQFPNYSDTVLRNIAKGNQIKARVVSLLDSARGYVTWSYTSSFKKEK